MNDTVSRFENNDCCRQEGPIGGFLMSTAGCICGACRPILLAPNQRLRYPKLPADVTIKSAASRRSPKYLRPEASQIQRRTDPSTSLVPWCSHFHYPFSTFPWKPLGFSGMGWMILLFRYETDGRTVVLNSIIDKPSRCSHHPPSLHVHLPCKD